MIRIVGATEQETANTVSVGEERETHVRCGADILLSGLYQDVKGEAICPVCGSKSDVVIEDARVISVKPKTALLHYVVGDQTKFSICCSGTFIFDKKECLDKWLASYGGKAGKVSSIQDFLDGAARRRGPAYP
jgi:hypothetical protein